MLFQIPIIKPNNFATILVARFLTGCFAGPALATVGFHLTIAHLEADDIGQGGSTLADMFEVDVLPIVVSLWSCGAVAGPIVGKLTSLLFRFLLNRALGPVIASFAVEEEGWRWSIYILLILGGAVFLMAFLFLPETYAPTILKRRAERLRQTTGNKLIRSQGEIDEANGDRILTLALRKAIRAGKVSCDPALLFTNIYM